MKKLVLFFALTILSINTYSQANPCAPEEVKNVVMELLKDLDSDNVEQWTQQMISFELFSKLLAENTSMSEEEKEAELSYISDDIVKEMHGTNRVSLSKKGTAYNIDWKKIAFKEFLYKLKYRDGMKVIDGSVFFNQKEELFKVEVEGVYTNGKYEILKLIDLSRAKEIK